MEMLLWLEKKKNDLTSTLTDPLNRWTTGPKPTKHQWAMLQEGINDFTNVVVVAAVSGEQPGWLGADLDTTKRATNVVTELIIIICDNSSLTGCSHDVDIIWTEKKSERNLNGYCKSQKREKLLCCESQANNNKASCQLQGLWVRQWCRFTDWAVTYSLTSWKDFCIVSVWSSSTWYCGFFTCCALKVALSQYTHKHHNVTLGWSALGHRNCVRLEALSIAHVVRHRDQRLMGV